MKNTNKILLTSLISAAVLSLTACGGGSSDTLAQHPDPDLFAPVITMNGDDMVVLEVGDDFVDAGATATDNVDSSVEVITSGFVDTNTAGTYTLTYTATDKAGNPAIDTRTIKVIEKENFAKYDGVWEISCEKTDIANLNDLGVHYLHKIMTINHRNTKYRMRGFGEDNSSCSGAPTFKGTAFGRVIYTGKILTGSYTGDKVDVDLTEAHYSGTNNVVVEVSDLDGYASQMNMPKHDILALTGDGKLLVGDTSNGKSGNSNASRPVIFDTQDPYYKK